MGSCDTNPIGFVPTTAWDVVPERFDWFVDQANYFLNQAKTFNQALSDYEIVALDPQYGTFSATTTFTAFEKPEDPADFVTPNREFSTTAPAKPNLPTVSTSGLNVAKPSLTEPSLPSINIPAPPIVNLPNAPGDAPAVGDVDIPVYEGGPLPDVPTLYELNLPEAPDISFDDLNIERPEFIYPDALQDTYTADFNLYRDLITTDIEAEVAATGVTDVHGRLQTMLAGGTGLPVAVEQALFDRAIGREEVSVRRKIEAAAEEWAARGFSLPGAAMLAREQEIRVEAMREEGRLNRELTIQYHQEALQNLRFSVQQAIGLEGTLLSAYTQMYDLSRQLADGHWTVVKGIYDSHVDLFRLTLDIYRTDVQVYRETLQAELAKLEIYRSELEAQRLIGTLNQQLVDIYVAELQGMRTNVEVFSAQVSAANTAIQAELGRVEVFKSQIDAYTAQLQGERVRYDIYKTGVDAEETKAAIYNAQVDGFTARINAYRTEVDAEATKVNAKLQVNNSRADAYEAEVRAWSAGVEADSDILRSAVEVYRANLQKYQSLLTAEQYRVQGESRNSELEIEQEKSRVAALLKEADQNIEQLKHITALGLGATETAAKVNAQLAASAMAAINVGATMNASNQLSASDSRQCSTSYSGVAL